MHLFNKGDYQLSGGAFSKFKIDCDALTPDDWDALASIIASKHRFNRVVGIPQGGLALAEALQPYAKRRGPLYPTLLVDDVVTTGATFNDHRMRLYGDGENIVTCLAVFNRSGRFMFRFPRRDPFAVYSVFDLNSRYHGL